MVRYWTGGAVRADLIAMETLMNFGSESLLVTVIVGGVAGWLAGLVLRGSGYGIIGDVIVGLLGAYVGSWLVQWLRITVDLGNPILNKGVVALAGAVILMFLVGFFRPRSLRERVSTWFQRK